MNPRETANDLARLIGVAVEKEVLRRRGERRKEPRDYVYASGIKPCARRMALDMLATDERVDAEGAARMMRGTERETDVIRLLEDAGKWADPRFRVVQGELPVKIKGRDGSPLLSGRLDGRLMVEGMAGKPPFEVKSGRVAERCFRYEDFARSPWGWSYPRQLLVYLLSTGEEFGYLVLDTGGLPRLVPVVLEDHLDDAEEALRLSEEAVAAVKAGDLPEFHRDRAVCKSCPFFMGACSPPIDYGEGFGLITDPRVIEALETRARTEEAADQFEKADKEAKALLKGAGHEGPAIAGRFAIEQSWGKSNVLEIPATLDKALNAAFADLRDRALIDAHGERCATRPIAKRFEQAEADLKARLRGLKPGATGITLPGIEPDQQPESLVVLEREALAYREAALKNRYLVKFREVIPAEEETT